jgi:hypothetical protein
LEYNLLNEYPKPLDLRVVGEGIRTVKHRLVASKRGKDFFDGDRNFGYGGFTYDGRWKIVAKKISDEFLKKKDSKFLQINCEKGFLIHDIKQLREDVKAFGTETSDYAITNSLTTIRASIKKNNPYELDFPNDYFDYVIALGVIYTLTLADTIRALKEIDRVSNGNSFITLATYETEEEYFLFKDWTLLGALLFKREEWLEILKEVNYKGNYWFTDAKSLNLIRS